ncbi:hypothetical protein HYALB_00000841 [Hymenoscyphus albidus]|uniref:Uncharacterized protein n=1 Tax=Hymenoscyphus albidus TaxID=595503 RepID=A0A9N9Q106_9HELO|nr:hypothetical protein HYALB_00000841 [Hymenoscyphus albidus]
MRCPASTYRQRLPKGISRWSACCYWNLLAGKDGERSTVQIRSCTTAQLPSIDRVLTSINQSQGLAVSGESEAVACYAAEGPRLGPRQDTMLNSTSNGSESVRVLGTWYSNRMESVDSDCTGTEYGTKASATSLDTSDVLKG